MVTHQVEQPIMKKGQFYLEDPALGQLICAPPLTPTCTSQRDFSLSGFKQSHDFTILLSKGNEKAERVQRDAQVSER